MKWTYLKKLQAPEIKYIKVIKCLKKKSVSIKSTFILNKVTEVFQSRAMHERCSLFCSLINIIGCSMLVIRCASIFRKRTAKVVPGRS